MLTCSSCGQETPEGSFCIRCGAPLGTSFSGPSRGRSQFAAAPHEPAALPLVVSTLFPQLPRGSQLSFRLALGLGIAAVIALAALRLFPAALIAAALLLPTLVVLYLIDVDAYEDEPVWAMSLTMGWGAAAGVGLWPDRPGRCAFSGIGDRERNVAVPRCPRPGPSALRVPHSAGGAADPASVSPLQRRPRRGDVRSQHRCSVQRRTGDHLWSPSDRRWHAARRSGAAVDLAPAVAGAGHASPDHGRRRWSVCCAVAAISRPRARRRRARRARSSGRGAARGRVCS